VEQPEADAEHESLIKLDVRVSAFFAPCIAVVIIVGKANTKMSEPHATLVVVSTS